ncbi:MAG: hypothetical protein ABSD03_03890 [Vulcanimicrobiaceae bacterium]
MVLIHGVGDPYAVSIGAEAMRGLAVAGGEAVAERSITITRPATYEQGWRVEAGQTPAVAIEFANGTHVLVPVVWSRLRYRALSPIARNPFDPFQTATLGLMQTCADAVGCIPYAAGRWKVALATLVACFIACFVVIPVALVFLFRVWFFSHVQWDAFLALPIFLTLAFIVRRYLKIFDLAGDVLHYVGSASAAREAQQMIVARINDLALRAPQARILLIGHSLGSVLAVESCLRLQTADRAFGRVALLTLGSPLARLARIFPGRIVAPTDAAATFRTSHRVQAWGNLWRDRDFVGRELYAGGDMFVERSLGDGYHWGMLESAALWEQVYAFISALEGNTLGALQGAWADDSIDEAERREARETLELLKRARQAAEFTAFCGFCALVAMIANRAQLGITPTLAIPFYALLALSIVPVALAAVRVYPGWIVDIKSPRKLLAELRLARNTCFELVRIGTFIVAVSACYFIAAWFLSGHSINVFGLGR